MISECVCREKFTLFDAHFLISLNGVRINNFTLIGFLLVAVVFEIMNGRRKSKRIVSISSLASSWRRILLLDTLI